MCYAKVVGRDFQRELVVFVEMSGRLEMSLETVLGSWMLFV